MNSIVLAYDDSEPAQRALQRAAELVKGLGAQLTVISIAPTMASSIRAAGAIDPADPPAKHAAELETARQRLEGDGISAEYQALVGEPAAAIVLYANEHNADLVVVGSREPGFVGRLLGQSVSESVSHHAHCDVLLVH